MMRGSKRIGRGFARAAVVIGLLGLPPAARPALAWTYPLLPHVNSLAFFPETPNNSTVTGFLLSAVYPDSCWQIYNAMLVDSAHVLVGIRPASACGDTGSHWTAGWQIGGRGGRRGQPLDGGLADRRARRRHAHAHRAGHGLLQPARPARRRDHRAVR